MTRINLVSPSELTTPHLIAEYREIMRLPNNLYTSLNRKSKPFTMDEIPKRYVLGKGHVTFFFDKFKFLQDRFDSLVKEMLHRGYSPNFIDFKSFSEVPKQYFNDYIPTNEAIELNRSRIADRLNKRAN